MRLLALPICAALVLSGCTTPTADDAKFWGATAGVVGTIVKTPVADAYVETASDKLAGYCDALRALSAAGTVFASQRYQLAAQAAQAAVLSYCAAPPKNVAQALKAAADAYAAAISIRSNI